MGAIEGIVLRTMEVVAVGSTAVGRLVGVRMERFLGAPVEVGSMDRAA